MTLNFRSYGSGPPLIVLHGLFGMSDNWQTFARKLDNEYSIFCLDLRNHGRSPHDTEMNYHAMAEDIRTFLEEHWIYKCAILGHSMGGKVAMRFALDHPDLIEKAIYVDISPRGYEPRHTTIIKALQSVATDQISSRQEADEQLEKFIPQPGVRMFLLKNLKREARGFQWKFNLDILAKEYKSLMSEIKGSPINTPTLFIKGKKSNYIQAEDELIIKKLFPNSSINEIADAGHWVHTEQPEVFAQMVRSFLSTQ